jgi:hypothetical protein
MANGSLLDEMEQNKSKTFKRVIVRRLLVPK